MQYAIITDFGREDAFYYQRRLFIDNAIEILRGTEGIVKYGWNILPTECKFINKNIDIPTRFYENCPLKIYWLYHYRLAPLKQDWSLIAHLL